MEGRLCSKTSAKFERSCKKPRKIQGQPSVWEARIEERQELIRVEEDVEGGDESVVEFIVIVVEAIYP